MNLDSEAGRYSDVRFSKMVSNSCAKLGCCRGFVQQDGRQPGIRIGSRSSPVVYSVTSLWGSILRKTSTPFINSNLMIKIHCEVLQLLDDLQRRPGALHSALHCT